MAGGAADIPDDKFFRLFLNSACFYSMFLTFLLFKKQESAVYYFSAIAVLAVFDPVLPEYLHLDIMKSTSFSEKRTKTVIYLYFRQKTIECVVSYT